MYQYQIDKLSFNDGSEITPGNLTVIVGPNNCGKSRILKDIKSLTSDQNGKSVVVERVDYSLPSDTDELVDSYEIKTFSDINNQVYLRTLSSNLVSQHNVPVGVDWKQSLQRILDQKNDQSKQVFSHWFGSFFVSLFETEERLKLAKETESSERGQMKNLLQAFYQEGTTLEEELRKVVKEAFNIDIKLDYSSLRKILFRIGHDFNDSPADPRDALSYYAEHDKLDEQGDGLRSFVATLLAVLVGKRPVLLLDEPESFLHPPQAYRLGEVIAEHAVDERQVVISTHSSEFLRGILSKRQDITLIRVDRTGDINKLNCLDSSQVAAISSDPLLSSTRIMEGLFYKGAIIVEADADAIFYQRIARQLKDADNFHIAHAHNKQTVAKVLPPYRDLGIPFSAIVDFDVIRVRNEFRNLLTQIQMPSTDIDRALALQSTIVESIEDIDQHDLLRGQLSELEAELNRVRVNGNNSDAGTLLTELSANLKRIRESGSAWKAYKKEGVAALDESVSTTFNELSELCCEYGLFIVPVGELEGWLVEHGLSHSSNKSKWIVKALEMIPNLEPKNEDQPWQFLQKVFSFLAK
ncbi:ATP-binding protein [Pseudohongiella nitratireducens]|uniref:ATP-dependent nuclease n=1 Tax=Pseudohongiella nitratireducens TaxID=1768907 RepID=UPI0030EEB7A8|tara:strand:+ start:12452 stop:14194 length:1743 start_codon:yes stop_codon:yes gene_type:complete